MKFKNIVKKSKKIIKYTRHNYQLPPNMDKASTLYLLARAVNDIGKNKKVIRVKTTEVAKTEPVKITLKKNEYKLMANYIVTYINDNKTNPTKVPVNKNEISINLAIYVLAKVVYSYSKNKKLPKKITCDSSVFTKPKKKYGHATEHGCDQMGQNTGYYCGVHSLQEVFRNLTGIIVKQSTIAAVAGTTTSGTSHQGLETAVAWFNKTYNQNLKVQWLNLSDIGWNGVKKVLESNDKDIVCHNLYRNQWGHYEVINKITDLAIVQNSLGSKCTSSCYCGYVENRTFNEFKSYISGISQKSIMVITNEK